MASFLTKCPHCQTSFSVSDEQFRAANGVVRCGSCMQTFSSAENRADLPINSTSQLPRSELRSFATRLNPFAYKHQQPVIKFSPLHIPDNADGKLHDTLSDTETAASQDNNDIAFEIRKESDNKPTDDETVSKSSNTKTELHQNLSSLDHEDSLEALDFKTIESINDEPLEIIASRPRSRLLGFSLLFANLLLILLLAAQYIWFNLADLMINPRLNNATGILCQYVTCPAEKELDLANIHTDALSVRSHPIIVNALQVDFVFRNSANVEQKLPLAELNFSDMNNRLLSNRQFTPLEYLPPELRQFTHIPANSTIQVSLEIMDPGAEAVNYSLTYRLP